jgi:hypothetical protein
LSQPKLFKEAIMFKSPWKYDTAAEESVSLGMTTGGWGTMCFINSASGETFEVDYIYGALGPSKGAIANFAKSIKSTPSGRLTHVYARPAHTFGPGDFACGGYLAVVSATAGIFAPSFFPDSGASLVLAEFGLIPFATVAFWGLFDSLVPSTGICGALCKFSAPRIGS